MSYVICSNIENEDDVSVGGFADPASFLNSFRSPLILEVDSEIAVESVKIDRAEKWDIKQNNNFFVYFGLEQNTTTQTSGKTTKNGVRVTLREGSYNVVGMALELTRAINTAPIGPEIFGTCSVQTTSTGTGQFNGFTFDFNPATIGADIAIVDAAVAPAVSVPGTLLEASNFVDGNGATIKYRADNADVPAFTFTPYNSVGPVIAKLTNDSPTRVAGDMFNAASHRLLRSNCSIRQRGNPLSAASGELVVKFRDQLLTNNANWCIGLSRAVSPYVGTTGARTLNGFPNMRRYPQEGTRLSQSELTYFDFWVQWDAADDQLKVWQWKQQNTLGGGGARFNVDEIKYYDAPNRSSPAATPWSNAELNADNIDRVIFKIDGNELIIKLSDAGGGAGIKHLVDSQVTADLDKQWMFPALSNETDTLFPTYIMSDNGQEMEIIKYNANNLIANDWKDVSETSRTLTTSGTPALNNLPDQSAEIVAGSDWYSNLVDNRIFDEIIFNAERPALVVHQGLLNGVVYADTYPAYTHATTVLPYLPALVLGNEPANPPRGADDIGDYARPFYVIPLPHNEPNMSYELGFGRWPVAGPVDFVTNVGTVQTITSIEASLYTVHSAFIRINDLPIQSYNGATSSRSNILYHIPRFSNDGRQSGELFFPVPEKTYIKLNNTQKIMLNQLQIDVVGRNERIVTDLKGSSIVCLHIRKAQR